MILARVCYSRLPTFQVTGGFLCAPKLFRAIFECVLLNTIVELPREVVLLNTVLDVSC